ncbi:MAG: YdeI family protein [Saprospiraceae bacterium]
MQKHKTVEEYLAKQERWREALTLLRNIMLSTEMEETVKWGAPVYTVNGKNIVGLGAFKSYVGLWFFQGALLEDKKGLLINAQEGKTKALRQWRFNSMDEMDEKTIRAYVAEAIENQKQGREIKPAKPIRKPLVIPAELLAALATDDGVKKCFGELSLPKQREYAGYISETKQEATKQKRLQKILPLIAEGRGLYDKYKNG